jgi:crotonobetainyl-CoA:carnitine CoA-transferase CaiB-like acyl-CoA transferase
MPASFDGVKRNAGLIQWMTEEGMATDFIKNFDWETFDYQKTTQDVIDEIEEPTRRFFFSHTMPELLAGAVKHRIFFYPQFTAANILADVQLIDRGYWSELEHPELGVRIKYPGAFVLSSEMTPVVSGRAPLIGEHNAEVYGRLLGISQDEMTKLRQARII